MDHPYWFRQDATKLLFPDLEWSRPQHASQAGKLLIIGGNAYGFAAPATAYMAASQAGIGSTRVMLPQRVRQLVGNLLDTVEYAMGNPSGGFSQMALSDVLEQAQWADGVLLAGDFGRNSETAVLIEKFLASYTGPVSLTKDAVDYFTPAPAALLQRPQSCLVLSSAQLQKLAIGAHTTTAFTFDMDLVRFVDALHDLTLAHPIILITKHLNSLIVAVNGQVSTTKVTTNLEIWRVMTAAQTIVWWLQNPSQPFEAMTTALYEIVK